MPHVVVERYEQIAHQPHEEVAALGAFGLQNSDRHSIGHAPPRRWIARSITPRAMPDRTSSRSPNLGDLRLPQSRSGCAEALRDRQT
jgi:hypothetical protein